MIDETYIDWCRRNPNRSVTVRRDVHEQGGCRSLLRTTDRAEKRRA